MPCPLTIHENGTTREAITIDENHPYKYKTFSANVSEVIKLMYCHIPLFIAVYHTHINCHFTFVGGALGRRRLAESLLIPIPIGPEPRGQAVLYVVPSLPLLQEARQSVSWALTLKDSCFISRKFIRVASVKEIILNL